MRTADANTGDTSRAQGLVVLLGLFVTGAIFVLDLRMPVGVAVGAVYIPIIAFASLALGRRSILALGSLMTLLTIVGWWFSPADGVPWMGAANRVATLLALWSVVVCRVVQHHGAGRRATDHERTRARQPGRTTGE